MSKHLIVGLGVVGGSIAEALFAHEEIYGLDIDASTMKYAYDHHLIKNNNPVTFEEMEYIWLCLYPEDNLKWLETHHEQLQNYQVVIDVSGVKGELLTHYSDIMSHAYEYVAVHPMAGKESQGIRNADGKIFDGANFIIIPLSHNKQETLDQVTQFARLMKFSNIKMLSIDEHDAMIAYISQLPHVLAMSLMMINDHHDLHHYTGDSFRDLTRIANMNERLWSELFLKNKGKLVYELDKMIQELSSVKNALLEDDKECLEEKMVESTKRRQYF